MVRKNRIPDRLIERGVVPTTDGTIKDAATTSRSEGSLGGRVFRLRSTFLPDSSAIHDVLDAMPTCSVGCIMDCKPYVTPTLQWREGEHQQKQ